RERAVSCELEGEVGGKIRERVAGGGEHVWGTVRVWEPPARLVFSWHPGRSPRQETEVEVRFSAEGEGTRVELEHRGWEVLGAAAGEARGGYETGWEEVFCRRFASHADRSAA
ncbi:MAG: SRPBCC domain-containing protein, partial [Holophagales bacterium]|nr:SRPBCC domain-containing protein [Holophagales bacterium]